jgi:alkaline phosphatase
MNVKFKAHLFIFSLFFCYNLSAQEIVKGDFKNENPQSSYVPSFDMDATDRPVKNVILMIGDGMGLAHICSGMYANQGQLTITNLKTCGFVRTQSANKFTTDSAASGTAYSTGKKTKNGALGMDENTFQESLPLTISTEPLLLLSLLTNRNVECLKKFGRISLTVS